MKNLLLITIFFFSSLSFYAQDKYKSIAEYKTYDWITVKKVRLPEYAVANPGQSDELMRFSFQQQGGPVSFRDSLYRLRCPSV